MWYLFFSCSSVRFQHLSPYLQSTNKNGSAHNRHTMRYGECTGKLAHTDLKILFADTWQSNNGSDGSLELKITENKTNKKRKWQKTDTKRKPMSVEKQSSNPWNQSIVYSCIQSFIFITLVGINFLTSFIIVILSSAYSPHYARQHCW